MRGRGWSAAFWGATGLGALAVLLIIANTVLLSRNQTLQVEVNQRQQFINESVRLGGIDNNLIRALASASVTNHDDKLRAILAEAGVTFTVNPSASPAPRPGQ